MIFTSLPVSVEANNLQCFILFSNTIILMTIFYFLYISAIVLQNDFSSPVLPSNNNSMEKSPPDVFINCTLSPEEFSSLIFPFKITCLLINLLLLLLMLLLSLFLLLLLFIYFIIIIFYSLFIFFNFIYLIIYLCHFILVSLFCFVLFCFVLFCFILF